MLIPFTVTKMKLSKVEWDENTVILCTCEPVKNHLKPIILNRDG